MTSTRQITINASTDSHIMGLPGSPVEQHLPYRPEVDGLRALAILAVLGFHTVPRLVRGGFVGVDVFFVISGYLISSIIIGGLREDRFSLRHFYARRIRRIFPALLVVLVACFIIGWLELLANEYTQFGKHMAAASGFSLNLVLWRESGYFDTAAALKPLLHLWSLGVEEQFYIVWPLLLWLAWKRRINLLTLTLVIIAASFWLSAKTTHSNATAAFYSPLTRFWELAIGCSLAFRRAPDTGRLEGRAALWANITACVGLVLIAVAALGLNQTLAFPGWWAILPTMGAFLLISADSRAWVSRNLLSHPLLVWVGLISYPLYLWHWPLLSFARIKASAPVPRETRLGLAALSILLAWLTFKFVERPARRGSGMTVGLLVALMIVVGSAGAYTFKRNGFDHRFPASIRAYANFGYSPTIDTRPGCLQGGSQTFKDFPESCVDEVATHGAAKPLMFVWGDSFAARLYTGLNQVHRENYRLAQFTRDSCPPLLDLRDHGLCPDGNAFILRKIEQTRPMVVVLFGFWSAYAPAWPVDSILTQQLFATITALSHIGIPRVIVVGPSPRWIGNLPRLIFEASVKDVPFHRVPRRMTFGLDPSYAAFESSFRQLMVGQPVEYFSIRDAMCNQQGCLTNVADGVDGIVSWDYGHFTTRGASYVAERLLQ